MWPLKPIFGDNNNEKHAAHGRSLLAASLAMTPERKEFSSRKLTAASLAETPADPPVTNSPSELDEMVHATHQTMLKRVVERLLPVLRITRHRRMLTTFENTVSGAEIAEEMVKQGIARDNFEAISIGNELVGAGLLCHARDAAQPFKNKSHSLYRFAQHGGFGPKGTGLQHRNRTLSREGSNASMGMSTPDSFHRSSLVSVGSMMSDRSSFSGFDILGTPKSSSERTSITTLQPINAAHMTPGAFTKGDTPVMLTSLDSTPQPMAGDQGLVSQIAPMRLTDLTATPSTASTATSTATSTSPVLENTVLLSQQDGRTPIGSSSMPRAGAASTDLRVNSLPQAESTSSIPITNTNSSAPTSVKGIAMVEPTAGVPDGQHAEARSGAGVPAASEEKFARPIIKGKNSAPPRQDASPLMAASRKVGDPLIAPDATCESRSGSQVGSTSVSRAASPNVLDMDNEPTTANSRHATISPPIRERQRLSVQFELPSKARRAVSQPARGNDTLEAASRLPESAPITRPPPPPPTHSTPPLSAPVAASPLPTHPAQAAPRGDQPAGNSSISALPALSASAEGLDARSLVRVATLASIALLFVIILVSLAQSLLRLLLNREAESVSEMLALPIALLLVCLTCMAVLDRTGAFKFL